MFSRNEEIHEFVLFIIQKRASIIKKPFCQNYAAFNVAVFTPAKSSESFIANLIGNLEWFQ